MNVSKSQNDVSTSCRRYVGSLARRQSRNDSFTKARRIFGKKRDDCVVTLPRRKCRDVFAMTSEQWRQNFGIPTIARPDFHDRLIRPHAKKCECFDGVTIKISRDIFGVSLVGLQQRLLWRSHLLRDRLRLPR